MKWPDPSDYQDAVQNPSVCFLDRDLRAGRTAVTALGMPRVASGNYASVYELGCGPKKWAVRCFLRQVQDHQRRYALVSQHLHNWATPNLVGFAYLPAGIRLFGQNYPIIKMDWVEGHTLVTYVESCLPDGAILLQLASQWRSLVRHLQRNQIAHGDLQHGNVLVMANGNLRLVDYDAMYVPALRGEKCLEIGHRNFQHPKRTPADFDERLDDFSAIVIYASLRALAADPDLWIFHDDDDKLILAEEDYKAPRTSPVFARLIKSPDAGVCFLAREIAKSSLAPTCSAPRFSQIVEALPEPPPPKKQFAGGAVRPRPVAAPTGPQSIPPPSIFAQRRPQPFGAIPTPAPLAWPQPQFVASPFLSAKRLVVVYLALFILGIFAHPVLLGAIATAGILAVVLLRVYTRSWGHTLLSMGCIAALMLGALISNNRNKVLDFARSQSGLVTPGTPAAGNPNGIAPGNSKGVIAFVSSENNSRKRAVCVMNPDGSAARVLSKDGYAYEDEWSPDGKRILFCGPGGDYYVIERDGTNLRKVLVFADVAKDFSDTEWFRLNSNATWMPDGKTISFNVGKWPSSSNVYLVGLENLSTTTIRLSDAAWALKWSPDGKSVAFTTFSEAAESAKRNPFRLWVADSQGQHQVPLSEECHILAGPTWLTDSRKILFVKETDGYRTTKLCVVDAVTRETRESPFPWSPFAFALSPDGQRIAFSDHSPPIHVLRRSGDTWQESATIENGLMPTWSPDSKKIAFIGAGDRQIWLSNADGTGACKLEPKVAAEASMQAIIDREKEGPEWSPS